MRIESFAYSELWGQDRQWKVEKFPLDKKNLFVGKNASGKTRILNCIHALASILKSPPREMYESGHWQVEFITERRRLHYSLVIEDRQVARERVYLDDEMRLERGSDGSGRIWNDQTRSHLRFRLSPEQIAAYYKQDAEQHSFLEMLKAWARNERFYQFSSELGKRTIYAVKTPADPNSDDPSISTEADRTTELYTKGYSKFGDEFDRVILRDLKEVGYDCESVEAVVGPDILKNLPVALQDRLPVLLQLKERDLPAPTRQFEMSLGMYRAMALIIHFNFCRMSKLESTVIIDDIGEGLDFDRSTALINTIMKRTTNSRIQIILSTNDRFVMNEVDLDFWKIVDRAGNVVRILDKSVIGEKFERFERIGLSNFDFFSRGFAL